MEQYSPNKDFKAIVYQIDCGTTTGFNTHVDIHRVKKILPIMTVFQDVYGKKQRKVFLAENGYTNRSTGKHGEPEVFVHWEKNNVLVVQHHCSSKVKNKSNSVRGVNILFQPISKQ